MDFKSIHLPTVVVVLGAAVVLIGLYHFAFHMKGGGA